MTWHRENSAELDYTSQSKLESLDKTFVWHPYTAMKDWFRAEVTVIHKAQGRWLIDVKGRRYLDCVSSIWCNVWGHSEPELVSELVRQAKKLQHSTLLGLSNTPAILLAKKLAGLANPLSKVFFSDDGSTAVEASLKIAVQYWRNLKHPEKKMFVALQNAYHGDTAGAMSVGGVNFFFSQYKPLLFEVFRAPSPYHYRSFTKLTEQEFGDFCLSEMEKILKKRSDRIAAVILESMVQMAGGVIVFPRRYLSGVRKLCDEYEVLMILDEVATGFGRTGKMFAQEHENVAADIMTVGKMLTAGYLPLAATLTTQRVFDAFLGEYQQARHLFHGHTFGGNPLASSVALKNLELYEKRKLLEGLKPKIQYLEKRLNEFFDLPIVGDIRHLGFVAGIELVRNKRSKEAFKLEEKINYRIFSEALKRNLFLRPIMNIILVVPPLAITMKELDLMMASVEDIIKTLGRTAV